LIVCRVYARLYDISSSDVLDFELDWCSNWAGAVSALVKVLFAVGTRVRSLDIVTVSVVYWLNVGFAIPNLQSVDQKYVKNRYIHK